MCAQERSELERTSLQAAVLPAGFNNFVELQVVHSIGDSDSFYSNNAESLNTLLAVPQLEVRSGCSVTGIIKYFILC